MRKLFILGAAIVVSVAMLMTACKKDETNNNVNNNGNTENPGGGGSGSGSGGSGGTQTGYVDLGLPSGTKWKASNETTGYANVFYTYDEAVSAFGDMLPTKEQFDELRVYCTWEWQNNGGYKVTGTNGNSIVLPAAGFRTCGGDVGAVGSSGYYWSSTPFDSENAWYLFFYSGRVHVTGDYRCYGFAVRLVQD